MIRGVANLLAVGREGVVILPAQREHGRIVVAGSEIDVGTAAIGVRSSADRLLLPSDPTRLAGIDGNHKDVACASLLCTHSSDDRAGA